MPIVSELELFDGNIVLLVCSLEHISAGTGADLLLKHDISDVDSEVVLALLELRVKDVTRLLRLSRLTRILAPTMTTTAHHVSIRLALLTLCLGVHPLKLLILAHDSLILLFKLLVFLLLLEHVLSRLLLLLFKHQLVVHLPLKLLSQLLQSFIVRTVLQPEILKLLFFRLDLCLRLLLLLQSLQVN